MGSDFAINVPEGVEWPHGVPFKDWLHAERAARGWSLKEFATRLKDAAGDMSRGRPRVTSIETLIRRWEGGRTAISEAWLLIVIRVFNETPGDARRPVTGLADAGGL